ncbi:MAG: hypothetical protein JXQ72_01635, partial [Anaerolineae bacterium]|nr:hypothetical protein [Anaerolineae bacterium]
PFGRATPDENRPNPFGRATPDENRPSPFGRGTLGTERPSYYGERTERTPLTRDRAPFASRTRRADSSEQRLAFTLPRPVDGWPPDTYHIEATVNGDGQRMMRFKVIEVVKVERLEPGTLDRRNNFTPSHVFLSQASQLGCNVHLEDAPAQTRLVGSLYNTATGTLMGHTSFTSPTQGNQTVLLKWQNINWRDGLYRIEVGVEDQPPHNTEIEVVSHITAEDIQVCHRVDRQQGAIGSQWPFHPGDTPHCVVELGPAPPGIEIKADWHTQHGPLPPSKPFVTGTTPDQRTFFAMVDPKLKPGHYSVVIHGTNITREERSFEVKEYPLGHRAWQFAQTAGINAFERLKKYHLDKALAVTGLTFLLALLLLVTNASLDYLLGADAIRRDPVLTIGHAISRVSVEWFIGWLLFGAAYGLLHTRDTRGIGGNLEDKLYAGVNMVLVAGSSLLLWYQVATIAVAGPGLLRPDSIWGIFDSVRWLTPVVAWIAPTAAVALAAVDRAASNKYTFFRNAVFAAISVLGLALVGFFGALLVGITAGVLGAILEWLLRDVTGVDIALTSAFRVVGASAGFIAGPITIGLLYFRPDLEKLQKDWNAAKRPRRGRRRPASFLHFLSEEKSLPLKVEECEQLAGIAARALVFMGLALIGLWLLFDPVVIPVLEWLYHMPEDGAFADILNDTPLIPLAALALWIAGPGLLRGLNGFMRTPDLKAAEQTLVHGMYRAALLAVILAPVAVALISRTPIGTELTTGLAFFWISRVAVMVMAAMIALRISTLVDQRKKTIAFSFQTKPGFDDGMLILLAALAGILVPLWMWALVIAVTLGLTSYGVYRLRRIK